MSTELSIQAVVFDAVGTIIVTEPPVIQAYHAAGQRFGSQLDVDEIGRRFRAAFAQQEAIDREQDNWRTSEPREVERWRKIVANVFDDVGDREGLFVMLWDHFAQPRNWRLAAGVEPVWNELQRRGLTLAIASNFDARLVSLCRGLPPLDHCRHIFVSSRIGARKPSRDFFCHVSQSLGVLESRIMMVGDDWENDIVAARATGWQAVLYDPTSRREGAASRITRFEQLLDNPRLTTGG